MILLPIIFVLVSLNSVHSQWQYGVPNYGWAPVTSTPSTPMSKNDQNGFANPTSQTPVKIGNLPRDYPIDLVDVTIANLTASQEDFKQMGYFSPPLNCARFWHLFSGHNWQGCAFWYGPSMTHLVGYNGGMRTQTEDGGQVTRTTCEFNTPLYVLRDNYGRNIRHSTKKVKGHIEFIRDLTIRNSGPIFATAIRLPLGNTNSNSFQTGSYLGGQSVDIETLRCSSSLKMLEIGNWMQTGQGCSFWLGPPSLEGIEGGLPGNVGLDSYCTFLEVNQRYEFTKLHGQMVDVDADAKKVMERITLMMLGTSPEKIN